MTDQARVEAAAKALHERLCGCERPSPSYGIQPWCDSIWPVAAVAALTAADAAQDQPRNHAPWCSRTHDGPCPAEDAVQPSREDEPLDSLISPIWRHVHEARAERDAAEAERDALRAERDQLREAITEALHWHAYSLSRPDEDGNRVRIEKVEAILRAALDAREA